MKTYLCLSWTIVERSLRQAGIEIGQVYEAGNGLEALAVLNERKVNLQALSAGARGYIRKPFTPDQVKEHIVPVLAGNL